MATVAACGCALVVGALGGAGAPEIQLPLNGGTAWLATPEAGLLTLVDGASERVVGAVRPVAAEPGDSMSVIQAEASAYVVNDSRGTISWLDGATFDQSDAVRLASPDSALAVQLSDGAAGAATSRAPGARPGQADSPSQDVIVIDPRRRSALLVEPDTLALRDEVSLAARPGPEQSVVDDTGRLWVIDAEHGGLTWLDADEKRTRPDLVDARGRLVLVDGEPVLVDLTGQRAGRLDERGRVRWSCLDVPDDDGVRLLGSGDGLVAAVAPATGTLRLADLADGTCRDLVRIGDPGDDLGAPLENGGYLFVPNRTDGTAVVVDPRRHRVVAEPEVASPGAALELIPHDTYVFYNDLGSERAGVIKLDEAGRWVAGEPLQKFDPDDGEPELLAESRTGPGSVTEPTGQPPPGESGGPRPSPGEPTAGALPPREPPGGEQPVTGVPRPGGGGSPAGGAPSPSGPGGPSAPDGSGGSPPPDPGSSPPPAAVRVEPVSVVPDTVDLLLDGAGTITVATAVSGPAGATWRVTLARSDCALSTEVGSGTLPPSSVSTGVDVVAVDGVADCGPGRYDVTVAADHDGVSDSASATLTVTETALPPGATATDVSVTVVDAFAGQVEATATSSSDDGSAVEGTVTFSVPGGGDVTADLVDGSTGPVAVSLPAPGWHAITASLAPTSHHTPSQATSAPVKYRGPPVDLLALAPSATWRTSAGAIPWGSPSDDRGYALVRPGGTVLLEDNSSPTLLETHPQWVPDGWITGDFALPRPIVAGDRFQATIGFIRPVNPGADGQDATFVVEGVRDSGATVLVASVRDTGADGVLRVIDADLSTLEGVETIRLRVDAGASSAQDWASWVAPRVVS